MEFIPRAAQASPAPAPGRSLREIGVAAVAAALGMADTLVAHAPDEAARTGRDEHPAPQKKAA